MDKANTRTFGYFPSVSRGKVYSWQRYGPIPKARTRSMSAIYYQAVTPLGDERAHIRFRGIFQDHSIIWDAHLLTLAAVYRELLESNNITPFQSIILNQFMEISPARPGEYGLRVGLDVPCIDEPTVFKTIIMINNYKRLQLGRRDYQPSRTFPVSIEDIT